MPPNLVTHFPIIGPADLTAPTLLTLHPCTNGYRRSLYAGRVVSVYYDHHPRNEWGEHTREQEQVSAVLDDAACLLKWKPVDQEWREVRIQGPSVWLIPAGTPHALVCPEAAEMVTLFMDRELAAEVTLHGTTIVTVTTLSNLIARDALIGQLAQAFRRLCRGHGTANELYVESIGTVFAVHLLRALLGCLIPPGRREGLPDEALQKVTRYIDDNAGDCLNLTALGRAAGFSRSHFGRLFKMSLGMPPHEYVMRRRVAKAEELLQSTDKKEVEIAYVCGFSDDTLMARWFRRVLGCRPSDIRAQRRR